MEKKTLFVHYLYIDILSQVAISCVRRHDYTFDNVLLRNFIAITTGHAVVMTRKLILRFKLLACSSTSRKCMEDISIVLPLDVVVNVAKDNEVFM